MNALAKPQRFPLWVWAFASAALHALLALWFIGQRPQRAAAAAALDPAVWMEAPAPRVEAVATAAPEPPAPPPARVPHKAARSVSKAVPKPNAKPAAEQHEPGSSDGAPAIAPGPASGEGTLAVGSDGAGATGVGAGRAGAMTGSGEAGGEPERKPGPAQLSLWMDVDAFTRLALVRPGMALAMAVPGLRDMLRGSGVRPFVDLQLLRVSLSGTEAARLALAGVHGGGEQALMDVTQRIAAMRGQQPIWRGDADLHASSWVDGTGVDRGLAVHGGAFVIAPRASLPALLGAERPAQRVQQLSKMRERAALLLTIEDAARYLPLLRGCSLQAMRLSISTQGDESRMSLTADYAAASLAGAAGSCLRGLEGSATQLSSLVEWLARAKSIKGRNSTSLEIGVTSADIERLLNELAWALRSA